MPPTPPLGPHFRLISLEKTLFDNTSSSKRLRSHFEPTLGSSRSQLGADFGSTWGQLGANLGLRRGSFSLRDENDEICTAPAREQDFQPPGGSKTGPDSVRNSIFESSSTQEATSKPFWRLFTRLPADLGPTWGQLGANLGPWEGYRGESGGGQNRSWRPPGPKRSFRGHLGAHSRPFGGPFGGRNGVEDGSFSYSRKSPRAGCGGRRCLAFSLPCELSPSPVSPNYSGSSIMSLSIDSFLLFRDTLFFFLPL